MKALTLHEPWASLIAKGTKTIETRGWRPPPGLIGQRIAIHAGMNRGPAVRTAIEEFFPGFTVDRPLPRNPGFLTATRSETGRILMFRLGCIVATARLVNAARVWGPADDDWPKVNEDEVTTWVWPEMGDPFCITTDPYGDFSHGRWLWFLDTVRRPPERIPAKGAQGLWNWDASRYPDLEEDAP